MRKPIIALAKRRREGHHPGLILQRYLSKAATGKDGDSDEKWKLLDAAIKAGQSADLQTIYASAYDRWNDSFPEDDLNLAQELRTEGRLIIGLGSENVLETGIRLHHTYGVPLIPGSALKGIAAHYCNDVWGQRHQETADEENQLFRRQEKGHHRLMFGTMDDGGVITFHDAWITPPSLSNGSLRLDVMTPHHPQWQTNAAPPTDFDSPRPVAFLSVVGTFQMRISWSGPIDTPRERARQWTELAMNLLREGLHEWGVGGKTRSGYGRLIVVFDSSISAPPVVSSQTKAVPQSTAKPGDRVDAVLLEERTKRKGWKARHEMSGLAGPIQNTNDVPGDKQAGQRVTLIVASVSPAEMAFRFPTAADEQRATKPNPSSVRRGRQ